MNYKQFCGGIFETNCYLLKAPQGWILFDAPQGSCEWVKSLGIDLKLLLLTHGHVDHVQDVARIKRQFGCPIGCHSLTAPMISDREFFRSFGFELEIEPAKPDFLIDETPVESFSERNSKCSKFPGIARAAFVSFCRRIDCLSAATCFLPQVSAAGIYRAAISIC
jgi:glyoxylase-like metal-dependent hydrolase (beta-lactamase superfamily II)